MSDAKQHVQAEPDQNRKFARLISKLWIDPLLKGRFLKNPEEVFAEFDIAIPAGKSVKVVENTGSIGYFTIPERPTDIADNDINTMDMDQLIKIFREEQLSLCASKCFG